METIYNMQELEEKITTEKGLLIYFSSEGCHVCKVLKPKVAEMLSTRYPGMASCYVDTERSPLLAGQHRIFTIPTILLFFEGRESGRFSRNIGLHQLEDALERPYGLLFGE